jgi:hypothetical protein
MRPRGHKRQALENFVTGGGQFTMGQLARTLNWTVREADKTLGRALASGEVRKVGTVRTPEAKRPVVLYEPTGRSEPLPLCGVMRLWAR